MDPLTRIRRHLDEITRILDELDPPPPAATAALNPPESPSAESPTEGVVRLVGKLGRPQFQIAKGIPLWTAGLGVLTAGGQREWVNVVAWRETAEEAREFGRGQEVEVSGKLKEESYVGNDGTLKTKVSLVVSSIVPA